ncbi:PTB_TBC1D1_like and TBC domain-containing protein plx [Brevipalpus obovatus]|uniref:PTB_TBC1D1_like and TBC domain-containing protein plx n=1 Tax=Brevipalpus obovatus TaxID=246614 RepID=UPI003D9F6BBA
MLLSFPHQFRMDPPTDIRKTPTKSPNPVHRTHSGSPIVNYTSNSLNTNKFSHILANSHQFEVMYVGKVKVYQKRAPPTFIDDAVESFHANDDHKVKFNLLVETENDNGQPNVNHKADDSNHDDRNSMNESGISTLHSFSMSTPQSPSNCFSSSSSSDNMMTNELAIGRPRSISALTTCKEYKETFEEESSSSSSYPNSTCSSPQVTLVNSSSSNFQQQIDAKESTRKSSSDTGFTELSSITSDLSFSKHTSSSSSASNHPLFQLSSSTSDERDSVFTDSEASINNDKSSLDCTTKNDENNLINYVASIPRPKSSTGCVDLASSSANLLTSGSLITNTQSLDEGRRASIMRDLKAVSSSSNAQQKLDSSGKNADKTVFEGSGQQSGSFLGSQMKHTQNSKNKSNKVVEIGKRSGSSVSESSSIGDKNSSIMMSIGDENSGSMNSNESISVDIGDKMGKQASFSHRIRTSSGGNGDLGRRARQSAKYQNRTMLFLIGRLEICLLSPDLQQVLFSKTFNYVSHCSRGVKYADHFGFICRETSFCSTETYVGYVFRCQTEQLVNEIMHTLKQAFHNAHQAYLTSRNRNSTICDSCPMQWYHRFHCEVESVSPERAQALILERLDSLPEPEKSDIMSAYEGSKVSSIQEQNDIFMRLLREAFEKRQAKHIHNDKRSASALDNLKQKARKSLSNSFETILKLAQGDTVDDIGGGMNSHSSSSSPRPEVSFSFDEHLGSSSRPRSSTIGGVRDLQMHSTSTPYRRHLGASRSESIPLHPSTPIKGASITNNNGGGTSSSISPLYNIFFKLGSQKSASGSLHEESISETCENTTSIGNRREKSGINSGDGGNDGKVKSASKQSDRAWHRAIFRNVKVNTQNMDKSNLVESMGLESIKETVPKRRRSKQELRELWRKTINQQITLIRMERENKKLQKKQSVVVHKRMKLDYEEISPCLKETSKMWEDVVKLDLNDPSLEYKLKDIIRKGVPRQKRGEIWLFLAKYNQTHGKIARNSPSDEVDLDKSYRELLKSLTSQQHAILVDLGRTFPKHPYFCQPLGAGQLSLFNLLKAYSLFDWEVGYCQGLSFVAAILLLHVNEDDSFEMMKYLLFHIGFREQYKPDMSALQMQLYQLTRLLYDYHHKLYEHFDNFDIMPTLYAAPWFLTLFASQFPIGFVARLFDLIFFFGIEAVFRVSLALLASYKEILLQSKSFESIMEILRNDVPKMDVIQMERVFSQVFTMDISKPLIVYEAEYNVLQEEMLGGSFPSSSTNANANVSTANATASIDTHSGKHTSTTGQEVSTETGEDYQSDLVKKLEAQNKSLESQNMELQDQLHVAQSNVYTLESSLETYKSTIKRLEDRVRSLEEERYALFDSLNKLRKRNAVVSDSVKE